MKLICSLLILLSFNVFSQDALIYSGEGACQDGCFQQAGLMASMVGLNPVYVRPENYHPGLFDNAKVWIQPGGFGVNSARAMGPEMMKELKDFVSEGGAYVGFCAGAFLATKEIGSSGVKGLGIAPGLTRRHYRNILKDYNAEPVWWKVGDKFQSRTVYWEGGPVIKLTGAEIKKVEVMAWYKRNGWVAALKTKYGQGKVAISAIHPEAGPDWFTTAKIKDTDGILDYPLATELIEWASK